MPIDSARETTLLLRPFVQPEDGWIYRLGVLIEKGYGLTLMRDRERLDARRVNLSQDKRGALHSKTATNPTGSWTK